MEGLVLLELEGFDPFVITFDDVCALLLLFIPNEKDNKNDSVSYKIIRSKTEWGRKTGYTQPEPNPSKAFSVSSPAKINQQPDYACEASKPNCQAYLVTPLFFFIFFYTSNGRW